MSRIEELHETRTISNANKNNNSSSKGMKIEIQSFEVVE